MRNPSNMITKFLVFFTLLLSVGNVGGKCFANEELPANQLSEIQDQAAQVEPSEQSLEKLSTETAPLTSPAAASSQTATGEVVYGNTPLLQREEHSADLNFAPESAPTPQAEP